MLLCACGQQEVSNAPSNAAGDESPGLEQKAPVPRSDEASSLVPDFPGSTPLEVPNLGAPGTDTRSGNATLRETSASPDQVASFYREHFRQAGIPVRADTANANGGLISVARDGERGAMLTITPAGGKTRIGVVSARGLP
ncbi:MAG: hypothetical protein ACXWU4_03455 [Allosphingosinicella sp.]